MTKQMTERKIRQKLRISARRILSICLALIMFLGSVFAFESAIAFSEQRNLTSENPELEWDFGWDRAAILANYAELVDLPYWQLEDNELTELPPEVLEAFLREQEAYFTRSSDASDHLFSIDELNDKLAYAVDVFYDNEYQEITPMSEITHDSIVGNPFAIRFNANDSVSLNTGASRYRINVLNIPGRNGFDLNLDLVYSSSRAYSMGHDLLPIMRDLQGLPTGWLFDLPYIWGNSLYVPGRGSFLFHTHTNEMNNPLRDMTLSGSQSFRQLTFHNGTVYTFNQGRIISKVDRFGNTITFEYIAQRPFSNAQVLSRIIDTNGNIITFTNEYTLGANGRPTHRAITITDPGGDTFTINSSAVSVGGFLLTSIQNQAGAVTTFSYQAGHVDLNRNSKNPSAGGTTQRTDWVWLLSQVHYPSGAQLRFEYNQHIINLGLRGSRHLWRTSARVLHYNGREYLRTAFGYSGCHTGFPSNFSPQPGETYGTTVIQNNGLRTVYTFDYRHLNINKQTRNAQGELLLQQWTWYTWTKLPTIISSSTVRNGQRGPTIRQEFTHNRYGQVTQVISPLAQGSTHERYRTDYTYDGRFGLPLTRTFRPDAQTTVVERNVLSADGRSVIRSYVYENNVRQKRTDFFHDAFGNVIEIREFYDNNNSAFVQTQITYNSGTRPSMIRRTGVRDANGTLVGNIDRNFTYDPMWRVLTETDPNGYTTRFQYDGIGRITRIDFPGGGFATYAYDDRRNTLTHRTVLGAVYTYQYNGLGNLTTVSVDGREILRNIHDNRKRVIETRNVQGIDSSQRTAFTYDIFDRVIERRSLSPTNAILHRKTTQFNDLVNVSGDRQIRTMIAGTGFNSGDAPDVETFARYDLFGRRTIEGSVWGAFVHYTHDLAGRVITEQSLGVNNTFTYNVHGLTSVRNILGDTASNTYDMLGRLVTSTDFMGNVQRFTYDTLGRLLTHHVPFERSGTTVHYAETRYFYDNNSNLIRQSNLTNIPGQAQEWASTNNAFAHNRLVSSETGGACGIRTTYTYDLAGNVLTKTVGEATTTFTYNNRGQLVGITDALGQIETFAYDANGNLITHIDRNGTAVQMSYDNLGRMVHKEAQQNGIVTDFRSYAFHPTGALRQVTNGDHTITYYYDAQGRLRRQAETGGTVKTFAYNLANNLTQSRVYVNGVLESNNAYTFDTAQRLQTVTTNGELTATYTYNANNQRTSTVSSNNLTTTYTHNLAGLITNLTNRHGNTFLSSFDYLYYLDGNTRQVTENLNGSARIITYTYDLARRLTREQTMGIGARTESFAFDNRGNRVSRTVTGSEDYTVTYVLDLNNRLLTSTRTPTGGTAEITTFSYDNNGNQLTKTVGGMTETKTYNAFNQLISVYIPAKEKTAITSADINVIAPIIGTELSNIATGTGNFSISPVTWSPNDTIASANTNYTATVTLTANAGYTFEGLEAATINGNPTTISNNTGGTVSISYTFSYEAPALDTNRRIAAGGLHTVALRDDGTVWVWGGNWSGQLGDGTRTQRNTPIQVMNIADVISVSAGGFHTVALREDGTVWAWGENSDGQLGDGTNTNRNRPVQVRNLSNVIAISAGFRYTVALREDGTVWTWGINSDGQLGDGTTVRRNTPTQVRYLTNVVDISAGESHTVAVKEDGTVWAWGWNWSWQLGDRTTIRRYAPVQAQGATNMVSNALGWDHTMALREDGTVWAWGDNNFGQIGDGTRIRRYAPVQVRNSIDVISITAGRSHSAMVREDGTVWVWGDNSWGQLGDGTTTNRASPVQLHDIQAARAVSASTGHNVAVSEDGTVWAWGMNDGAQLGDGTTTDRRRPVQVRGPGGIGFFNLSDEVTTVQGFGGGTALDLESEAVFHINAYEMLGGEIRNVFVTVNAPKAGETPEQLARSMGNFIVTDVEWAHGSDLFSANTRYTLSITLMAGEGDIFGEALIPMINRYIATVVSNTGDTLTLALEFPKTEEVVSEYMYEYRFLSDNEQYIFDYDIEINEDDDIILSDENYTVVLDQEIPLITYVNNSRRLLLGSARNESQTVGAFNDTMQLGANEIAGAYGEFSQLTSDLQADIIVTYTYRADGLRNSKTVNNVTTTHVWLAWHIVLELDGSGAIVNRFDRGIFGELIRSEQHGYYLHNKRGDVVQRVNAQGVVLHVYRYTAFGVEIGDSNVSKNPFRFGGEYWDSETGTYYLRARNFSPRLGRFTQEDPIRCGMNWYIFAFNNPIMFKDPTGLSPWIPLRSEVEAVGGSINWNINTNTAIATIGNLSGSFTAGTDGVQIRGTGNNGTMYVRADVFATQMFGNANQSVIFTSHNVFGSDNQHIAIVIFAGENSSLLTGNYSGYFTYTRFGMQYATIGGGGTGGFGQRFNRELTELTGLPTAGLRLTGEINHRRDTTLTNKVFWYNLNIHNISTINSLFTNTHFYRDHYQGRVAYGALPAANSRYFNSSSFAYGLLRASGITRPNLNNTGLSFPGWDKPLPNRAFTVVPQI